MKTLSNILDNFKQKSDCCFNDVFYDYLDTALDEIRKDDLIECIYNDTSYEFIYYSDAIQYLSENDPSLTDSIELATDEYGDSANNLNSCILASLLRREEYRSDAITDLGRLMDLINEELAGQE
jgi:hypothetical protein